MSLWAKMKMGFAALMGWFSSSDLPASELPLNQLKMPAGFQIQVYAEVPGARSMAWGDGHLFVGTRRGGQVYVVTDKDKNFKAESVKVLVDGLNMPNGVAFHKGDLYIAEVEKISKISAIKNNLEKPQLKTLRDDLPTDGHHGWKYLAVGPDEKLYFGIGAPCNVCLKEDKRYSSIQSLSLDGKQIETVAHGVRNTVGFDWNPLDKKLWFTENGRDWMGDDKPPCEVNRLDKVGQHFGFPFCHGGIYLDDEFGSDKFCGDYVSPVQNLGAHVAPLGMKFYNGSQFPAKYKNQIILAEHGSWNRSKKVGYKLAAIKVNKDGTSSYEAFIEGWLNAKTDEAWGRPVDVLVHPEDGSLLISDDFAGVIYRLSYQ